MAAGAAAGKFLHYEKAAPAVAAQTAYGIEAEIEGYEDNYDAESMLFMDFRRHHTGLWPDTAPRCFLFCISSIQPCLRRWSSHRLRTGKLQLLRQLLLGSCSAAA